MPADLFSLKSRNSFQYKKIIFNIDRDTFINFIVNFKRPTLPILDILI